MSALTKAFVVLVTVLSVLLTALVVSTVARYENQRDTIAAVEVQLAAAETREGNAQTALRNALSREQSVTEGLNAQVASLTGDITALQTQRDELASQLGQVQAQLAATEVSLAQFSGAAVQQATLLETINNELRDRRTQSVENQRQLIERADRIAELQGQLAGLESQVRRDRERNVALVEENRTLQAHLQQVPPQYRPDADGGVDPTPVPAVAIAGRITAVETISPEDVLVELNVGTADSVARGMEFMVHRNNNYIGTLVVEKADVSASVGRMTLVRGEVRENDRVLAGQGIN